MTIDEYRRGIPTYKGENGQTVGMLCETKEQCITDDDGVSLPDKLEGLKKYTDDAYANSNLYTDTKIGELINGAPTTLDTLKEIADAMEDNADVVEALDKAVGSKVDQAEYDGHADNDTIHVTAAEKEAWSKNGGEEIQAIINGTTTVGNANKLGGKGASEWQNDITQLNGTGEWLSTSILEKALEVGVGVHSYTLGGSYYTGTDLPDSVWAFGMATIYKRGATSLSVVLHSESSNKSIINSYNGVKWTGWGISTTTADLANCLPKSGGSLDGNLSINGISDTPLHVNANSGYDETYIGYLVGSTPKGYIGFKNGKAHIYQKGDILHSGNVGEYALPINSTGTLKRLDDEAMGGRLSLEKGAKQTDLQGNVAVDVYLNQIRFVEVGGNIRGAYIDFTKCGNACTSEIHHDGNSAKCVVVDTDPGVGASVSYADGTLIFVKE